MSKNTELTLSLQEADFSISSIDPAISEAIRSNLTQVIESRLDSFRQRFSEENGATVEQALKKARRENYSCKRKENQQQLDLELEVLDKCDEASCALRSKSYEKVKAALKEGTGIVSK